MLKKLIKYDFYAAARIFSVLYGIIVLLSIVAKIVITIIPEGIFDTSLLVLLVPTYFFLMIGLVVAGEIFLIVRFYKNLFTDEGYLTHTLPVKPWQLITSKLISNVALSTLGFIVILLCGLLLVSGDLFSVISAAMPELISDFEIVTGVPVLPALLLFAVLLILSEISGYLLYFAAIAFGQVLIPKHKILGAFAAYMIFYMAMQVVTSIPTFVFIFSRMETLLTAANEMAYVTQFYHFIYFLTIGLTIVSSIVFFFVSNFIMKKKLNLD